MVFTKFAFVAAGIMSAYMAVASGAVLVRNLSDPHIAQGVQYGKADK